MGRSKDLATGTFTTALDVQGAITSDGLTVDTSDQVIINHSGDAGGLRIDSTNNTNTGSIRFGDVADNYIGAVEYNHSTNALSFYANNATRMTIDSSGHVTTPSQPAFNVRGQASNTYSTSWQKLVYNDSLTQRGGSNYSTANSRFTAPVTGYYQFNAQWSCNNNSDADGTFTFWINGGVPANTGSVSMPDTGGSYDGHVLSCTIPLNANDYVEVYRYSTASSTSRGNSWQGNFSGYLIG